MLGELKTFPNININVLFLKLKQKIKHTFFYLKKKPTTFFTLKTKNVKVSTKFNKIELIHETPTIFCKLFIYIIS